MKIEKAIKALGAAIVEEMGGMSPEALKARVVEANEAMRQAEDELEANPNYQECKENLKALTSGKREVNSRQKAVIAVALSLLNEEHK